MTGNKPEDVLTEEYQNQSLFQLITSLASGQVSFQIQYPLLHGQQQKHCRQPSGKIHPFAC